MADDKEGSSPDFPEMAAAADEAEAGFKKKPAVADAGPVPASSLQEVYETQLDRNHAAHREMRWVAFSALGGLSLVFFVSLLWMLLRFANLPAIGALLILGKDSNWHVLVLLGLGLVVIAAIPLSLSLGLMKMISATEDQGPTVSTPTTEAVKVVADLISQLYKSIKG